MSALGLEFGSGIVGCVLIGFWVDRTFGTGHIGVMTGAILGCVGGMYHLVTQSIRWQRRNQGPPKSGKTNDGSRRRNGSSDD